MIGLMMFSDGLSLVSQPGLCKGTKSCRKYTPLPKEQSRAN